MQFAGAPIDVPTLGLLREHWAGIQDRLIADIDANYGVFEGRTFKADRWGATRCPAPVWPYTRDGLTGDGWRM